MFQNISIKQWAFYGLFACLAACGQAKKSHSETEEVQATKKTVESVNHCIAYSKNDLKKLHITVSYDLKQALEQAFIFSLSPDEKEIIYNKGNTLIAYTIANRQTRELSSFLPESNLFSEMIWSDNKEFISWTEVNGEDVRQAVLRLEDKQKIYYKISDLSYELANGCKKKIETHIRLQGNQVLSYTPQEPKKGIPLHAKYLYLNDDHLQHPKNVVAQGFVLNSSVYHILDKQGKEVWLPKNVKE